MRMIQKLSLIYGFSYNTEEEEAELWVAAASAAGVDISRELVEKQFVSKFVPRVIQRIAVSASAEIVEKWTARLIPMVSSAIGAGLNYYFVKVWGERALGHFRQKHLEIRRQRTRLRCPPAGCRGKSQGIANGALYWHIPPLLLATPFRPKQFFVARLKQAA